MWVGAEILQSYFKKYAVFNLILRNFVACRKTKKMKKKWKHYWKDYGIAFENIKNGKYRFLVGFCDKKDSIQILRQKIIYKQVLSDWKADIKSYKEEMCQMFQKHSKRQDLLLQTVDLDYATQVSLNSSKQKQKNKMRKFAKQIRKFATKK